jgi:hypothetical protein
MRHKAEVTGRKHIQSYFGKPHRKTSPVQNDPPASKPAGRRVGLRRNRKLHGGLREAQTRRIRLSRIFYTC